ncbi:Hypothetical predicted protein, partial [Pelobates cultripes]
MRMIADYGKVSYYSLNTSKTQALCKYPGQTTPTDLQLRMEDRHPQILRDYIYEGPYRPIRCKLCD